MGVYRVEEVGWEVWVGEVGMVWVKLVLEVESIHFGTRFLGVREMRGQKEVG